MFKYETVNPIRILNAVKRFIIGLGERGEVATTEPPVTEPPVTNWRDTLPPEIKSHPVFEKFKEPNDAFRSLVEAQKFLGREKLPVPKDANDKETYDLIFKTLGRPENADGYVLPTDLQIPKELPLSEEILTDFKKVAHENGILPQQFAGLYKWYMNTIATQYKNFQQKGIDDTQAAETELRKRWGGAYQQNSVLAEKVAIQFATEQFINEINKPGNLLKNNPGLIEVFANIGKVLSEDQLSGKPKGLTMTPDEAQLEINKIKGDLNHPYWKEEHQSHKEAVERMSQLTKMVIG